MSRFHWAVAFAFGVLAPAGIAAAEDAVSPALVRQSLASSLAVNLSHAQKWLDAPDYKSLAKSAGGLQLLAELLQAKSDDDAWQQAHGEILTAIGQLQASARGEDSARCQAELTRLVQAAAAAEKLEPAGQPLALPKASGGVRGVMMILEGVQGDAKIALLTGQPAKAKQSAYVLSELGRVLSNARTGAAWSGQAEAFIAASHSAAQSPANDAPTLKPLFRAISQRCEACHESR